MKKIVYFLWFFCLSTGVNVFAAKIVNTDIQNQIINASKSRSINFVVTDDSANLEDQLQSQLLHSSNLDVIVVRHITSSERSKMIEGLLGAAYSHVLMEELTLSDVKGQVLVISRLPITDFHKIIYDECSSSAMLQFSVETIDHEMVSFFVVNDDVTYKSEEIKRSQMDLVSEFVRESIASQEQRALVLCLKPLCLPGLSNEPGTNLAVAEFLKEDAELLSTKNPDQNISLVFRKCVTTGNRDLSSGYKLKSYIGLNSLLGGNSCTSSLEILESFPLVKFSDKSHHNYKNDQSFRDRTFLSARNDRDREASINFERDTEGNSKLEGSVKIGRDYDDGCRFEFSGGGSIERDADGRYEGSINMGGSLAW